MTGTNRKLSASTIEINHHGCHGNIFVWQFCLFLAISPFVKFETCNNSVCNSSWTLSSSIIKIRLFSCHDNSFHCFELVCIKACAYYLKASDGLGGGLLSMSALIIVWSFDSDGVHADHIYRGVLIQVDGGPVRARSRVGGPMHSPDPWSAF